MSLVRMSFGEVGSMVHQAGLVIVGERHGTNEFPHLFLQLVTAAARHRHLFVALELCDDAQAATAAFVRSAGTATDRAHMLATHSWQRQDGRASEAMFALIEGVRQLTRAGASIEFAAFDANPVGDPRSPSHQIERERMLAERLCEISTRGATIALAGNVHAELVPRSDAPAEFVPAAAIVAEHADLVSLVGRHAGGASWSTASVDGQLVSGECPLVGDDQGNTAFIDVGPAAHARAGVAYVGPITPSSPLAHPTPC